MLSRSEKASRYWRSDPVWCPLLSAPCRSLCLKSEMSCIVPLNNISCWICKGVSYHRTYQRLKIECSVPQPDLYWVTIPVGFDYISTFIRSGDWKPESWRIRRQRKRIIQFIGKTSWGRCQIMLLFLRLEEDQFVIPLYKNCIRKPGALLFPRESITCLLYTSDAADE